MKVTAIRATPVTIPVDIPFYWSLGLYPGTSKTITIMIPTARIAYGDFHWTDLLPSIPKSETGFMPPTWNVGRRLGEKHGPGETEKNETSTGF